MNRKTARKVLTLASSAILTSVTARAADAVTGATNTPQTVRKASTMATLSKSEIRQMLATIEKATVPEPKMGAMCYEPAMRPMRAEYTCPTCGEKTLYTNAVVWKVDMELDTCRRLFKTLPKRETMTLDESGFCGKCSPGNTEPALKLLIRFDNGATNTVANVTCADLRMLSGFLSGKLDFSTDNDGTSALKNQLPRLRELLGIKKD